MILEIIVLFPLCRKVLKEWVKKPLVGNKMARIRNKKLTGICLEL